MAENISSNTEDLYPDNNSKMQLEADAFLNAIADGADEDQADEAAFFAANPNGVVVDENGEVLESGAGSKICKGEKVEFIEEDDAAIKEETSDNSDKLDSKPIPATNNATEIAEKSDDESADELSDNQDEINDESLVTFDDLGLSPEVLEAVKLAGYETPSPIQAKAIPVLLQGVNLLGTAQTGTGKTAAFSRRKKTGKGKRFSTNRRWPESSGRQLTEGSPAVMQKRTFCC